MSVARVAIITGSAQGIGKAIAIRLANDGLNIVANDIPSKTAQLEELVQEICKAGGKAIAVVGDVAVEADVQTLVNSAVAEFGDLNVMVANAGVARLCPLTSLSVEEWDKIQSVNSKGIFLCYKTAAAHMIKQGRGGRLIGACSIAGKAGSPNAAAYCASKFAVRGLTQSAAAELRPHKITVNAYAPGSMKTHMLDDFEDSMIEHGLDSQREQMVNMATGAVEDVASLVSYMASEEAHHITGQTWNVDGGVYFD